MTTKWMDGWMLVTLLGNGPRWVHNKRLSRKWEIKACAKQPTPAHPSTPCTHSPTTIVARSCAAFITSHSGKTSQAWEYKIKTSHLGESAKMWNICWQSISVENPLMEAVKFYFCSKTSGICIFPSPWSFEHSACSAFVLLRYLRLWLWKHKFIIWHCSTNKFI